LGLVAVHVGAGLVCVVSGIGAMLSKKGRGRHSTFGTVYFWSLLCVFATSTALSIVRWAQDFHLFVLGALSFAAALTARQMLRPSPATQARLRLHVVGMATSYILLLTAFYVDNGKSLPLWRDLPTLAYWLAPAAVGLPLLAHVMLRHPLVRPSRRSFGSMR
jgi:lysylphosphatidylglycerol synthetase-like protein (DUF2156 family)